MKCSFWITMMFICAIGMESCTHRVYKNQTTAQALPEAGIRKAKPKNIILMIGDGMGLTQITAGMYENNNHLEIERCPVVGIHKPYAANNLITDSAAGATAFASGVKTNNGYLGLDANGNKHPSLLEYAENLQMSTGLVVTSTIVHATPAAFFAYQTDRDAYEDIAIDLLNVDIEFVVGGGKKYFDRRLKDSLDLVASLREKGYFVSDYFEQDYNNWTIPEVKKLVYFSADGDPLPVSNGRTYLPKATQDAMQFLQQKNTNGFFLMVEGSQIDWGGHANDSRYIISEMLDFNSAIGKVLDFAEKDQNTLVVITADHETGGYAINSGKKFGELVTSFSTTKHSADLIPVFAMGPGSEQFSGIYENTEIYHKLKKLIGR